MKPFPLPYRASLLVAFDLPQPAPARADDVSIGSESKLRPERSGRYWYADVIDVDPGNSPEAFVRAAYGQATGREPGRERVAAWAARPRSDSGLRRIDFAPSARKTRGIANCAASTLGSTTRSCAPTAPRRSAGRELCKGSRPVGP
jgi:hypothetical protein